MKFALLALLTSTSALASAPKPGYSVDIDFNFARAGRHFVVKRSLIIDAKSSSWTPLTESQDGVALLGRLEPRDDKSFSMTYMIVDTKTKLTGLNQMQMISMFGEKAEMKSSSDNETVAIALTAKPVQYESAE